MTNLKGSNSTPLESKLDHPLKILKIEFIGFAGNR